jgi:hypothetical protein
VRGSDDLVFRAKTPGHDHFPVFRQRLADGAERFLDRGFDEAAGVDDDQVGAGVVRRGEVALRAQLREDALRVDQRLRTA